MKKICLKKYYLGLWTHQKVHKKKKDVKKKNQKIRSKGAKVVFVVQ